MANADHSKISITAKMVAFFRQFSDIPYAKEVAEFVHAREALIEISSKMERATDLQHRSKEVRDDAEVPNDAELPDDVKLPHDAELPNAVKLPNDAELRNEVKLPHDMELPNDAKIYAPILEARYKSIAELIHKTGFDQVLELASGFSLRGLAMSAATDITYIESDLPGVNEEKRELLAQLVLHEISVSANKHHVVSVNALNFAELEAAICVLRKDKPLVVVTEGLLNYLSADERAIVAANVRKLLGLFPDGAWITPDFITRTISEDVPESIKRFRRALTGITERQLNEAAFENEEAINDFATGSGFEQVSYFQADLVPHLTSVDTLGLKSEIVQRLRPRMRIWLLSPAKPKAKPTSNV